MTYSKGILLHHAYPLRIPRRRPRTAYATSGRVEVAAYKSKDNSVLGNTLGNPGMQVRFSQIVVFDLPKC